MSLIIKDPVLYHGYNNKTNYFEGWYFKFVDSSATRIIAVIPGISINPVDPHSFIQVNDSLGQSKYYRFELEDFSSSPKLPLEISIGNNHFSKTKVVLNLKDIKGEIDIIESCPYNGPWPNIMGPFSYIPFMQCFHGVLSLNSSLLGSLTTSNEIISFFNGKGYIEKDWGTEFPKEWIWLQGNSFNDKSVSIMLSIAHIPWLGKDFNGFLGFLKDSTGTHYFSTYNLSKIKQVTVGENVEISIKKGSYTLKISAKSEDGNTLKAPLMGSMERNIKESVNAIIEYKLFKNNILLSSGTTNGGGLEIVGDIDKNY